jgi:ATP/maltotriose-dependent transcriptional regulator MalT
VATPAPTITPTPTHAPPATHPVAGSVAAAGGPKPSTASSAGHSQTRTSSSELVEPLTERELEVLQLLAQGRSNQEIAEQLIIALGTVKSYTSHIYGKLAVANRTQAILRAQELGLL